MKITEITEGIHDPHTFKALFLVGGPASGKTFIGKKLTGGTGLVRVNIDDFIEMFQSRGHKPSDYIERSGKLRDKRFDMITQEGLGVLIDGTGRKYETVQSLKNKLEDIGYNTAMVFVNADLETTLARNEKRKRKVDVGFLKKSHSDVQTNLGKYQQLFGANNFFVVDNSNDKNFNEQYGDLWKNIRKFLSN